MLYLKYDLSFSNKFIRMPKNDKSSAKTSTKASVASSKVSKGSGFSRSKERAHLAKTAYKVSVREATNTVSHKCPLCKQGFVYKSGYDQHRKTCGVKSCVSCTQEVAPTYRDLTEDDTEQNKYLNEVLGTKYKEFNKRKPAWEPRFEVRKYLTVVVDEETGKTEKRWITTKKYANFRALLDDDGETVIDENGEEPQYVDPDEVNHEGNDLEIVDE
jgi:hypothetical protein